MELTFKGTGGEEGEEENEWPCPSSENPLKYRYALNRNFAPGL